LVSEKELNMTSIAGVSSATTSELLQALQKLARSPTQNQTEGTAQAGTPAAPPDDQAARAAFESDMKEALVAAGLDESQADAALADVQSAISSALSEADGSSDPREVVQQAVDGMLQEKYGVDTDKLHQQMEAQRGAQAPPGPPPGRPPEGAATGATSSKSDSTEQTTLLDLLSQSAGSTGTSSWLTSLFPLVDEQA
jgi:hypothetical protein